MEPKEKLFYLLSEFLKGNYSTKSFCNLFTVTYDIETDYSTLSYLEKEQYDKLSRLTARFSPFEKDLSIPNVYVGEQEIIDNASEAYNKIVETC